MIPGNVVVCHCCPGSSLTPLTVLNAKSERKIVLRGAGPRKPVAGGASVTYADFLLFHVLDATEAL